jgi:hypothetical protein
MSEQLTCGSCGFSNEPERVYCHNCGAKLDRSLLPVVEADKSAESAEVARRRIRKLTNPAGYGVGQFLKSLLTVLLWAAFVASLILISRTPEGVPEERNELSSRLIQSELREATDSPTPRTIAFSEADVNSALRQSVKHAGSGVVPGIEFQRAYARLMPGVIHIGAQQSVWGYPIHSGVDYQLKVVQEKFTPVLLGGNFGRLPVRGEIMQYLDFAFQKLWPALRREREQMDRMQSVTVAEGQIVFATKPAPAR